MSGAEGTNEVEPTAEGSHPSIAELLRQTDTQIGDVARLLHEGVERPKELFEAGAAANAGAAGNLVVNIKAITDGEIPQAPSRATQALSATRSFLKQHRDQLAPADVARLEQTIAELGAAAANPVRASSGASAAAFRSDVASWDERIPIRYQQLRSHWETHADSADGSGTTAISERVGEALAAGRTSGSAKVFLDLLREIPGLPGHLRTGAHALFQNRVALTDDPDQSRRVLEYFTAPVDDVEATDRLQALIERGAEVGAVPGMAPLAASCLWALQDPDRWPPLWRSAEQPAQRLGWLGAQESASVDRYLAYRDVMVALDSASPSRAALVLSWLPTNFCGLDPSLAERCTENELLAAEFFAQGRTLTPDQEQQAAANAYAMTGDLLLAGEALTSRLSEVMGRNLRREPTTLRYGPNLPYRVNPFVVWRDPDATSGLGPRLWVTADRAIVGLFPGQVESGWSDRSAKALEGSTPEGLQWFRVRVQDGVYEIAPSGGSWAGGQWLLGQEFPFDQATKPGFADQIADVAQLLAPAIERLEDLLDPGATAPEASTIDDDDLEEVDHLALAAEQLMVDPEYIDELVWYLRDKGQIVLYGPPGTGKTYLARHVARALASQAPERVEIVQFHPATSYEDFFEGIRPSVEGDHVVYKVIEGPLARLAARAKGDPDHEHVLVIDELNRANLPKVLGELLFLLEYRDEAVATLYRERFELPANLLIIATMNTADRSIALVDAAMRRRFHFRPFFPSDEPVASMLRTWLERNGLYSEIADLLDSINGELINDLGRDLQLGPSHFMRKDIGDIGVLARVWRANIEPFIEDQLFDQPAAVARYRWDAVRGRYLQQRTPAPTADGDDEGSGGDTAGATGSPGELTEIPSEADVEPSTTDLI